MTELRGVASSYRCLSLGFVLLVTACGDDGAADGGGIEAPPGMDAAEAGHGGAAGDAAGGAGPDSDAGPGGVAEDAASADPLARGLGLDYATLEPGAVPRYEPDGAELTATPWPTDRLRAADGTLDLTTFPNPDEIGLLTTYLDYATEALRGYGANGSVYFELDGAVDLDSLPDPQTSMEWPKASALLVNVSADSDHFGEQLPLVFDFYGGGDDPYQRANTLSLRPVFGFPLEEGETCCALLTRAVLDVDGRHLAPAPAFVEALETAPDLAPLRDWLPHSLLLAEDLAAATCFTTDEPTLELRRVREHLHTVPAPAIKEVAYVGKTGVFHEFQGIYVAPNFQAGDKPYEFEGGQLEFDADGAPIVQLDEEIRFLLMVPTAYEMPEGGWPVVLYSHGTTGDFTTCKSGAVSVASDVLKEGAAMICIDQPLHGARGDESWNIQFLSFNVANPYSGRMSFRQAAIDIMSLARMVAADSFALPVGTTDFDEDVRLDPAEIHFFGHSHGGLAGAIAFGVEPELDSGVLSGAGGVLVETILLRKYVVFGGTDIKTGVALLLGIPIDELDSFHPTMSLVQMLVDATDPVNYARYWLDPLPGGNAKHVFVTEGTLDEDTPYVTTNALTAAAGVPLIAPVQQPSLAHTLRGLPTLELPVGSNIVTATGEKRTAGLRQWVGDHFVVFTVTEARELWKGFFRSIRYGAPPAITL